MRKGKRKGMVDAKKIEDGNETQVKKKNENEKPPTRQYHFEYDPFSLAPPSTLSFFPQLCTFFLGLRFIFYVRKDKVREKKGRGWEIFRNTWESSRLSRQFRTHDVDFLLAQSVLLSYAFFRLTPFTSVFLYLSLSLSLSLSLFVTAAHDHFQITRAAGNEFRGIFGVWNTESERHDEKERKISRKAASEGEKRGKSEKRGCLYSR